MSGLFGIYVHWPFCASKCPYCDFNSHVHETIDHAAWKDAYLRSIDHAAGLTEGREVTSVFFGGGTPSLMDPDTTKAVVDRIAKRWKMAKGCEITLEANPTSVEAAKFRAFREAGVNRVSIGVQAMNDNDLKFLGRTHSIKEAMQAVEIAAQTFERYSFDLMYARPEQTPEEWREELKGALEHAAGHLSLYQLTIEENTPFFNRHQRGEFFMPPEDLGGEFYEMTQEVLNEAGLPAYEISNHARAGQESVHNLTYWRYGDYAGIGPGAHGRLTLNGEKYATRDHRAPDIWLQRVKESGHGGHPFEALSAEERFSEALMMGLRLKEGVPLSRLEAEGGMPWDERPSATRAKDLEGEGLVAVENGRIRATDAGLQRLNGVLGYLLRD